MSNWSFIEHATTHLEKPRWGDQRQPTLWPSEASAVVTIDGKEQVVGKCRRAAFFRYLEHNYKFDEKYAFYEPLIKEYKSKSLPIDRYVRWLWRAGEAYEDYLIDIAKESGVYITSQSPLYIKSHNVSGKVDVVVINPFTNKYSNIEIKSVYGFGGQAVLGKPGERNKGQLGVPRDSNLMQIALYDWWIASADDSYEASRLVYGSRDTGKYAEYLITTELNKETGIIEIFYEGNAPNKTPKTKSHLTINAILDNYSYLQKCLDQGVIPERDYDLKYTEEKIEELYQNDGLNKAEKEKHEKRKAFLAGENKRSIKPVVKGDWQCDKCSLKNYCYESTDKKNDDYGKPRAINS